ncbi:DedA family protein [Trebonia sp.]|uniref:DedA family protein n=1 Tax=Trebonia sp. TaxID=2767075 RepID=UPI00262A7F7E|nr:DedA family protein [Trebonia sp.]
MTGRLAASGLAAALATGLAGAAGKPPLPSFLSAVQGPLDHYGVWAIGLLILLENIGVPVIPGELAMIAGAIYAGAGQLNVVAVGVTAFVAAVVGATIGYAIGRFAGRSLVVRYGRWVFVREEHLRRAERAVDKYGGGVVVIARFIVGLRELNGIICGVSGMNLVTFATYNVGGGAAWVATWVSVGYFAGDHIEAIYSGVTRYALYVIIAAAVLLAVVIAVRLRRRRRRRTAGPEAQSAQSPPQASDRS